MCGLASCLEVDNGLPKMAHELKCRGGPAKQPKFWRQARRGAGAKKGVGPRCRCGEILTTANRSNLW